MNVLFHNNNINTNNNNNNNNQKSNNKILINEKMKSKSLQSIEPTTNNYASISDEKINDIIFIEETTTPKFRMINQKLLHESKESLPIITSRNNNNNSQDQNDSHNHIKYNYVGSNSNYQDQSLLAVYSMSNNGFKTSQSPTNSRNPIKSGRQNKSNSPTSYQLSSSPKNHSSAFVLNTTKAIHMVERSSSKYGTNPNSSHSSRKNNSQLSTNEMKKFIPGRSVLNQTSPTPSIMSIVKPIMSNVFITPNSASNNTINNVSNTNISISNANNHNFNNANSTSQLNIKGQDASKLTSRLNKSGILRNELNQKSPTLPSTNQQQQPPMSPQQQNLYNITSNNTKSAAFVNNVNESSSNLNKSSIMMTREKTNLSSYFTNLMNSQLNSSKRVNTSKQNGQQTPPKIHYSRNELNSSINSAHNNTFGSLTKSNIPKHSNSFNYKLNIAVHSSQTPTTPTARNNIDNDIITGIGLKSASRQKITSEYPYNERNESRLLETTIQEVAIDEQSENENDYDNVMNSSKYQNARKQQQQQISSKMRTVEKQLLIKQTNLNTNQQQSSLPFYRKNSNENNNNNLHFDESLNFETEEERKYKSINTSRMMHHSRTSIKDTATKDNSKIFGSLIMTSSKSTSNNHNASTNNLNNKRHDSAKSFISRDINDSYAYNDVKKYIEENDLMPPDRAEAIKSWIKEVNSCLKDLEQTVY